MHRKQSDWHSRYFLLIYVISDVYQVKLNHLCWSQKIENRLQGAGFLVCKKWSGVMHMMWIKRKFGVFCGYNFRFSRKASQEAREALEALAFHHQPHQFEDVVSDIFYSLRRLRLLLLRRKKMHQKYLIPLILSPCYRQAKESRVWNEGVN